MYLNQDLDYRYTSLDGRSFLDALASVKYFGVASGAEAYLPYGYRNNVVTRWTGQDAEKAGQAEAQGGNTAGLDAVFPPCASVCPAFSASCPVHVVTTLTGQDAEKAGQAEAQGGNTAGLDAAKISVYENDCWLPLGYTYDRWISREEYE